MTIAQVEQEGFAMIAGVLHGEVLQSLQKLCEPRERESKTRRGGTRDVLEGLPELSSFAKTASARRIVSEVLGDEAFLVRATLFDKTPEANWKVPWHQDVTTAVKEKREVEGYGPWSMKNAVCHVQPPSKILERMLTIRIHLDPCPQTNGALWVLPESHKLGRINQNAVASYMDETRAVCCSAEPGDALVMRPLLLHSSSASVEPGHRRVLHFDYAIGDLHGGLE